MSFFSDVVDSSLTKLGINSYTIINFSSETIYIEGVKRIQSISSEEIRLTCPKAVISVQGEGLTLFDANVDCMIIKGIINSVSEIKD